MPRTAEPQSWREPGGRQPCPHLPFRNGRQDIFVVLGHHIGGHLLEEPKERKADDILGFKIGGD
jgi:hypothetical protein